MSDWKATDGSDPSSVPFESFFVAETVHDVPFELPPSLAEEKESTATAAAAAVATRSSVSSSSSNFTRGMRRYGLIGARMTRTLSPQCEQSPIKVSGYCTGGRKVAPPDGQEGSRGAWCYDEEGTAATKALLAQCAEVGVEMFVFPQVRGGASRRHCRGVFRRCI